MKKNSFLCPHCKNTCSNTDIICPECSRQVRNPPPTTGTGKNRRQIGWTLLFLIVAASVIFAVVIFMTVHRVGIAAG